MRLKHTSGPWIVGKDFHNDLAIFTIRAKLTGKLVAEVPDVDGADMNDAVLIAAAPDSGDPMKNGVLALGHNVVLTQGGK